MAERLEEGRRAHLKGFEAPLPRGTDRGILYRGADLLSRFGKSRLHEVEPGMNTESHGA